MKRYDLEYWRNIHRIKDGRHITTWIDETEQELIARCCPFEHCDYCGRRIRVDLGLFGFGSEIDCGPWKCDEYSCDSWICDECVEKLYSMILSTKTSEVEE